MCYSLNMSVEDIQALGRWASQAFMYYIRAGARAVRARSIQKKLADGFLRAIVRFFFRFFLVGGCLFFLAARGGVPPDKPVKRSPDDDLGCCPALGPFNQP